MSATSRLPPVEVITDFTDCRMPVKRIFTEEDIPTWLRSEAFARVMTVLVRCNTAVRSKGIHDREYPQSEVTTAITVMLDQLESWVDEIPLDTGVQRFGNKAFRKWGERLQKESEDLHRKWLPSSHEAILPELLYYFNNAFGNWTRIDYGSGHELSFFGFMTILRYTGLWQEEDEIAMVFTVFERYLRTCRKLQAKYTLEPAGSKGVWGLEDHQFLNLLLGSSQLIGHDSIRPIDILKFSPEVSAASSDYLFLSSVEHINRLKRGPFNEHSPILYNIATTVPNWGKVNTGLMKMYQAEVLEKHTVVQHFYFGGLLPWTKRGTRSPLPSSGDRPQEKEDVEEEEDFSLPTGATKAPWVDAGDLHPVATTVAPWASKPTRALPNTSAPWAASDFGRPGRAIPAPHAFARQPGHDLASTGSAAAMSSPLGAISQPIIRHEKGT